MSKITIEELEHVATLARLDFSKKELSSFAAQMNDILGYVAKLEELDTRGIPTTTHALHVFNVFRQDQTAPSLEVEAIAANAPEMKDGAFVVPRII